MRIPMTLIEKWFDYVAVALSYVSLCLDDQMGRILHCLPAVICPTIVNICSRYLIVPV